MGRYPFPIVQWKISENGRSHALCRAFKSAVHFLGRTTAGSLPLIPTSTSRTFRPPRPWQTTSSTWTRFGQVLIPLWCDHHLQERHLSFQNDEEYLSYFWWKFDYAVAKPGFQVKKSSHHKIYSNVALLIFLNFLFYSQRSVTSAPGSMLSLQNPMF